MTLEIEPLNFLTTAAEAYGCSLFIREGAYASFFLVIMHSIQLRLLTARVLLRPLLTKEPTPEKFCTFLLCVLFFLFCSVISLLGKN
jgi:uncharacterized protein YhhL (DUF1145 family)